MPYLADLADLDVANRQLSWFLRAHVVYPVLARLTAPRAVRPGAVEITVTKLELAAAADGLAGGSQPVPVCIRSACQSSVQVSSKESCRFKE